MHCSKRAIPVGTKTNRKAIFNLSSSILLLLLQMAAPVHSQENAPNSGAKLPESIKLNEVQFSLKQVPPFGWGTRLEISIGGLGDLSAKKIRSIPTENKELVVTKKEAKLSKQQIVDLLTQFYLAEFGSLPSDILSQPYIHMSSPGQAIVVSVYRSEQVASILRIDIGAYHHEVSDITHTNPRFQSIEKLILEMAKEETIR